MHVVTVAEQTREVGVRSQEEVQAVEIIITKRMGEKTLSCRPRNNCDSLQMPIMDRELVRGK